MTKLTREQKLELRKSFEIKYAEILADINHPLYDEVRFAMLAPEVELNKIDWHPVVEYSDDKPAAKDANFINGKCKICGETPKACECHQW